MVTSGMVSTDEWITRAECARLWGVSAQMVGKYCRRGMPSRASDKRLLWPKVDRWRLRRISPFASGNWHFRQRQKEHPLPGALER